MENKKSIVVGIGNKKDESYLNLIRRIFTIEKVYSFKELITSAYGAKVDMLIFTGGADVNPDYYNQPKGSLTTTNVARDKVEWEVAHIYTDAFKLGICRGAQLLTVVNGGRLIQHVNNHNGNHLISIRNGIIPNLTPSMIRDYYDEDTESFEIEMTSSHHQMMYPYSLKEDDYDLIAWSTNFLSTTYLNGSDRETMLKDSFLEPEIVYYPQRNSLCIQGHPEYSTCPEDTVKIINNLILNYM